MLAEVLERLRDSPEGEEIAKNVCMVTFEGELKSHNMHVNYRSDVCPSAGSDTVSVNTRRRRLTFC